MPSSPRFASGRCIYCGSVEYDVCHPTKRLSDEHVIPASIGGKLILRSASCKKCQEIINKFETEIFHKYLSIAAMTLRILGHKTRFRKSRLPIEMKNGETIYSENIHFSKLPASIAFQKFHGLPGLIAGQNLSGQTIGSRDIGIWLLHHDWRGRAEGLGAEEMNISSVPSAQIVSQYVAKICHAYACKNIGAGNFVPYLIPMIFGESIENRANYVGGHDFNRIPGKLHDISHEITTERLIVVYLQLFCSYVSYRFCFVVGENIT